jgi:hypothetical protein
MERSLLPRPIIAALGAILASLALAATATAGTHGVTGGSKITPPPGCQTGC